MPTNTGPAILSRLFESNRATLTPAAARSILELDFSDEDQQRSSDLSRKAAEGSLNSEEREELEEYLRVADLLAVLQSTARRCLQTSSNLP
jgi:hypothetical protein